METKNIIFCCKSISVWLKSYISNVNLVYKVYIRDNYNAKSIKELVLNKYNKNIKIFFLSNHDTLLEDYEISEMLRKNGIPTMCQSTTTLVNTTDKIKMKEFLNKNDIATIQWFKNVKGNMKEVVVKKRYGTLGQNMRYYKKINQITLNDEYVERFQDGKEYSINLYEDQSRKCIIFPAVYKGYTGRNMIHPSRKIRLCTKNQNSMKEVSIMKKIARRISFLLGNIGFMEIEFIINNLGEINVLEINPRVSGTLRMASMASNCKCFDLMLKNTESGELSCVTNTAEIPYHGEEGCDENNNIYYTSRATFSFNSRNEYNKKIDIIKKREDIGIKCLI